MYAIIKTGGKQYQVEEGKVISVEKLIAEQGDEVTFDDVLLVSGEDVKIGKPNVEGAKVVGVVLEQGKEAKIRIFKYKAKSNYRRRQGHRQDVLHKEGSFHSESGFLNVSLVSYRDNETQALMKTLQHGLEIIQTMYPDKLKLESKEG